MKVPLIFLGFWTFSAFSLFQVLPTESMALPSHETEAQTPIVGSIFPVSISNGSTAGGGHICQSKPVDLLFIIDSSRSVLLPQFHQVKRFITDVISVLHIGPLATRVGVIQYGSTVQSEFSLRDHWHKENMLAAVNVMQPLSTGTMTGLAITYALDNAFTEEAGARPKSQGIPRVAIIVTDGRPQDKVDEVAERARRAGLELHAVGVGHAQPPALRRIASHPTEEHIHYVENYGLIERISAKFRDRLCGEDACLVVEHGCEHRCVSAGKSYVCECEQGYTLAPDGRRCLIIDPCESGKHDCEQLCVSTNDSFICRCKSTFILNPDGRTCRSADPCASGDHACEHICVTTDDSYTCRCRPGFVLKPDGRTCDIAETNVCLVLEHGCEHHCVSTGDSYVCTCESGYTLSPDGRSCRLTDVCLLGGHGCEHLCLSIPGSFRCVCHENYILNDDGKTCQLSETNVCLVLEHGCEHHCVSTGDSYVCTCESGYALSPDGRTCLPTDVCLLGGHGCEHLCLSIPGSFRCVCHENYILNDDGKTCQLSDVCLLGGHGCEHLCLSIPGSFRCVCHENYILNDDGKTCQLADACSLNVHDCEHECISTGNTFRCQCNVGFSLNTDGKTCRPEGCQTPLVDIVFVLDSSKSVTPEGFEAMKRFVINMVGSLDVGPGRSRVGLLQYTRRVHPQFELGQYATASEVSEAVRGLQYYSGGTATGLALRHLTLKSFGETADEKPKDRDVSRVAIVITDGRAQDNAEIWAERARLAGIRIFAVGVGKAVESELKAIANDPDEEHSFYGADFSTMQQIADKLKHRICIEEEHKKKRKEKVLDVNPCQCNATVKFQQQVLSLVQAMDTKLQAVSKQLNKLEPQRVK